MKTPMMNLGRVSTQAQDLLKVKKESDKNLKLSQGMLSALQKMEEQLDMVGQLNE